MIYCFTAPYLATVARCVPTSPLWAPVLPRCTESLLPPVASISHCDPTASHYLKCVMDAIFGEENFRNEIIWQRTSAHNDGKQYGRIHDTILFYSKGNRTVWNPVYTEHDPEYVKKAYRHQDERGPYRIGDLYAPGGNTRRGIRSTMAGYKSNGSRQTLEYPAQRSVAGRR